MHFDDEPKTTMTVGLPLQLKAELAALGELDSRRLNNLVVWRLKGYAAALLYRPAVVVSYSDIEQALHAAKLRTRKATT